MDVEGGNPLFSHPDGKKRVEGLSLMEQPQRLLRVAGVNIELCAPTDRISIVWGHFDRALLMVAGCGKVAVHQLDPLE